MNGRTIDTWTEAPIRVVPRRRIDGAVTFVVELAPHVPGANEPLVIERSGQSVRTPSGRVINLSTRRPLQRLVLALAHHRSLGPKMLAHDALIEAAWPGERFSKAAARNRLGVAIYELREMGLRECLESSRAGHRFAPQVAWIDS
jgi:hypothetical protein